MLLELAILILAGGQAIYWATTAWFTRRHFRARPKIRADAWQPRVAVLKPLRGAETGAFECFRSFCQQNYPNYSILFGVASSEDAAVAVVQRAQQEYPYRDIHLSVGQARGVNPKVRILQQLGNQTDAEIFVISDADVRAQTDHLQRLVRPLADPNIGLVTCPYALRGGHRWMDRLETLRLATEFIPSALFARKFGVAVGFGAAMAFRRSDLENLGGFAAFSQDLLEDHKIAARMLAAGKRIAMLHDVVELYPPGSPMLRSWQRELRWARGIRAMGRLRYVGIGLTFFLPVLILAILSNAAVSWAILAALGVIRVITALSNAREQHVRLRFTDLLLLPVRDALSVFIWIAGLFGNRVEWRGKQFCLGEDGRIALMPPPRRLPAFASAAVRWLDALLRRRQHIFEFSDRPDCLLRLQRRTTPRAICLADGIRIDLGETIGELHFWNEHIPVMDQDGANIQWSVQAGRAARASMQQLARAAVEDERLEGMRAFFACTVMGHGDGLSQGQGQRLLERLGFEIYERPKKSGIGGVHDFFESLLIWALNRTFNRNSLRGKSVLRARSELWISRQTLLKKYPSAAKTSLPQPAEVP